MQDLELLLPNFFTNVTQDPRYADLHAQNYPKTLLGLNRWIPVNRILGQLDFYTHTPLFFFFSKKSGVTVAFQSFHGSVQISLSGSLSSALQREVLVFIGKRLTCGFLFSTSVGFRAFSFLLWHYMFPAAFSAYLH